MIRLLDLFSGIGGFSLGLERTGGFKTVAFCEIDPFCRKVLRKHWPNVPQYDDIRSLTGERLAADGIAVDAICGGFPCQDISSAGTKTGLSGPRSSLWSEYARIIGEIRPRFAIVENVADLNSRGLGDILGDLAGLGYDAEWHCISAAAVGAPHVRERTWIVAYPHGNGKSSVAKHDEACWVPDIASDGWGDYPSTLRVDDGLSYELDLVRRITDEAGDDPQAKSEAQITIRRILRTMWECGHLAASSPNLYCKKLHRLVPKMPYGDPQSRWLLGARYKEYQELRCMWNSLYSAPLEEAHDLQQRVLERARAKKRPEALGSRIDRLRSLGNAVVPQIPELIGRAILAAEAV